MQRVALLERRSIEGNNMEEQKLSIIKKTDCEKDAETTLLLRD